MEHTDGLLFIEGNGGLFRFVDRELGQAIPAARVRRGLPSETEVDSGARVAAVTMYDWWNPKRDLILQRQMRRLQIPWLPVSADFAELWIGPWILPRAPGCVVCTEEKRKRSHLHSAFQQAVYDNGQTLGRYNEENPFVFGGVGRTVASLVAEEVLRLQRGDRAFLQDKVLIWSLPTISGEAHPFFRSLGCTECHPLTDDSPDQARLKLRPITKSGPGQFRAANPGADLPRLSATLVSSRVGLVQGLVARDSNAFPLAMAPMPLTFPDGSSAPLGVGSSTSFAEAKRTALLEALERFAGYSPNGKKPILRASYEELTDDAVDPRHLILHSRDQYALRDFPYVKFEEDRPLTWVWAYSFQQHRPVVIPESLVYYGHKYLWKADAKGERPLAFETSNGCAIGNSLEEALLYGLFEVLERDAVLMTWYTRTSPLRIDLESAHDSRLALLSDHLLREGYDTLAFDVSQEFGIPSAWVMAVSAEDDPLKVKCFSASGCHLDPEQAVSSALKEVARASFLDQEYFRAHRSEALAMLQNSDLVESMGDHPLLYSLHEGFNRLEFLLRHAGGASVSFEKRFPEFYKRDVTLDLKEDLVGTIESVLRCGLDVVVVDQTTPELAKLGLTSVRVFVPGALPLTLGHRFRRLHGARRLERRMDAPGYDYASQGQKEVNPWPHPFA